MKINQVEELVGITKKNIRFYEEQGLIKPERNSENGYRNYSLRDVEQLHRVKLLRQLDVPCDEIRRMLEDDLTFKDCIERHIIRLERRRRDLEHIHEICGLLSSEVSDLSEIKAEYYIDKMKKLEQEGVRFMDVKKSDVSKRKTGAVLAAFFSILFMTFMIAVVIWGNHEEPIPKALFVCIILIPAGAIAGILIALRQRLKEIKGGELDEAVKY